MLLNDRVIFNKVLSVVFLGTTKDEGNQLCSCILDMDYVTPHADVFLCVLFFLSFLSLFQLLCETSVAGTHTHNCVSFLKVFFAPRVQKQEDQFYYVGIHLGLLVWVQ